jgi:hypothetical protein
LLGLVDFNICSLIIDLIFDLFVSAWGFFIPIVHFWCLLAIVGVYFNLNVCGFLGFGFGVLEIGCLGIKNN